MCRLLILLLIVLVSPLAQAQRDSARVGVNVGVVNPETNDPVVTVPTDTVYTQDPRAPAAVIFKVDRSIFSYGGLALVLSLLNLLGLWYLFTVRGKKSPSSLDKQIAIFSENQQHMQNQLDRLKKEALFYPPRPVPQPNPSAPEPTGQTPASPATPIDQLALDRPVNQPPQPNVALYARRADLGDGFSVGSLFATPNEEVVFEIMVGSDALRAYYEVVDIPSVHQLALSDPDFYLADACEYQSNPMPYARIYTKHLGWATLVGDKWKITEKAQIRFY